MAVNRRGNHTGCLQGCANGTQPINTIRVRTQDRLERLMVHQRTGNWSNYHNKITDALTNGVTFIEMVNFAGNEKVRAQIYLPLPITLVPVPGMQNRLIIWFTAPVRSPCAYGSCEGAERYNPVSLHYTQ